MSDLIERQVVLDAMYALCGTGETLKDNPWRDNPHIDAIADAINELPSAEKAETVTEFADRCRECGARYGKILKRYIEKDIETLNEIIETGWLISDFEKCTAIDACEDAITALKQYPVLDKVRAELEQIINGYEEMGKLPYEISPIYGLHYAIQIIDKYRGESKDAYSD